MWGPKLATHTSTSTYLTKKSFLCYFWCSSEYHHMSYIQMQNVLPKTKVRISTSLIMVSLAGVFRHWLFHLNGRFTKALSKLCHNARYNFSTLTSAEGWNNRWERVRYYLWCRSAVAGQNGLWTCEITYCYWYGISQGFVCTLLHEYSWYRHGAEVDCHTLSHKEQCLIVSVE